MRAFLLMLMMVIIASFVMGVDQVVLSEKWQHAEEIPGRIQFSLIDKDNCVVATFYKIGQYLISPQKVIPIIPFGQGPDEVTNVTSICHYKQGDLAIVEYPIRGKIFRKENDTYKWRKSVFFKRGKNFWVVHNTVFYDNKWFMAGTEILNQDKKTTKTASVKVCDEEGKLLKNLLIEDIPIEAWRTRELIYLRRYILNYKDKILFLIENELKAAVISGKNLKEEGVVKLEIPGFYKKMPDDFFAVGKSVKSRVEVSKNLENWMTSYSRITKAVVEKDWLIVQVRTCNEKLKRFALLFYRADTFKLEKTFFIDDLLLGSKDGKLYCYGGGDPGLDEGIEQTVINVYTIK